MNKLIDLGQRFVDWSGLGEDQAALWDHLNPAGGRFLGGDVMGPKPLRVRSNVHPRDVRKLGQARDTARDTSLNAAMMAAGGMGVPAAGLMPAIGAQPQGGGKPGLHPTAMQSGAGPNYDEIMAELRRREAEEMALGAGVGAAAGAPYFEDWGTYYTPTGKPYPPSR